MINSGKTSKGMNAKICYSILYVYCGLVIASCGSRINDRSANERAGSDYYNEKYRPQFHFSPEASWMNDPNGMVFLR